MKVTRTAVLVCFSFLFAIIASRCGSDGTGMTVPKDSIRGTVWEDEDKNGVMTDAEKRINGAEVQILDEGGYILKSISTDSKGAYIFAGLEKYEDTSAFEIKVIPPPGYGFTEQGGRDVEYASHVDHVGLSGSILKDEIQSYIINAGLIAAPPPESEEDASAPPTEMPTEAPSGDTAEGASDAGTCGSPDSPASWEMEFTTDNGDPYTLHFTFWGPTDLLYFYAPSVHYDGTDAPQVIDPLLQMLPGGVVGFTGTGCEGGCTQWIPDIWYENGLHATAQLEDIECLLPDFQVVMIGASTGAELVLYICPTWDRCIVGGSVSPDSYYGVPLEELIDNWLYYDKPWLVAWGALDEEMTALQTYTQGFNWTDVNMHQETSQNGCTFTRTDTADHGRDFLKNNPWYWNYFSRLVGPYRQP